MEAKENAPHALFVYSVNACANPHQLLETRYIIEHDTVEHGAPAPLIPQFETLQTNISRKR
jgi:hypothetical protein